MAVDRVCNVSDTGRCKRRDRVVLDPNLPCGTGQMQGEEICRTANNYIEIRKEDFVLKGGDTIETKSHDPSTALFLINGIAKISVHNGEPKEIV